MVIEGVIIDLVCDAGGDRTQRSCRTNERRGVCLCAIESGVGRAELIDRGGACMCECLRRVTCGALGGCLLIVA